MRVLVTGAGGTLGRALAPALADEGHEPVLFDVQAFDTPYPVIQGDIRSLRDIRRAMEGVELVVHGAAIHGIHLHDHSAQDFHELNVTGTFNTWEAAAGAGVSGFVFSSTMGVYGDSRRPPNDDAVVSLAEETPLRPADPYALSKVLGEEMCRYYGRRHGIPSIALRYGMFVPEPFFRYGIRLLYGGVDTADVAGSVMAAVRALAEGSARWEAFNVESPVPFTVDDGADLRRDALAVVDRYWPGARALLRDRGVDSLSPITEFYPMQAIDRELGFRPHCDFGTWLEDLRARPEERSETPVPWP